LEKEIKYKIAKNMEKELKIKTPDKKIIYGSLVCSGKKSDKLVIFVHGFTGHKDEHIFFNAAKFFMEKGFDTFRFNLYAGGKGSRNFGNTKISLHGRDINTIVKYFRKKYKKIYVIGHSYGGTSLLFTDTNLIDGYVFWDASYVSAKDTKGGLKYNKKINAYITDWGLDIIVGKDYINELKNFPDCGELIKNIKKPVLFITANKGGSKNGIAYFKKANMPKKLVKINTDHNFNTLKAEKILLEETYKWIR